MLITIGCAYIEGVVTKSDRVVRREVCSVITRGKLGKLV